jgi:hypothetical protein
MIQALLLAPAIVADPVLSQPRNESRLDRLNNDRKFVLNAATCRIPVEILREAAELLEASNTPEAE